jgi:MerR family transcriptional regulator, light-induced transcriptional regulator
MVIATQCSVKLFTEALLEGDHAEAMAVVKQWRETASRFYLYRDLITPAMYEVGKMWEMGEISVAEEHLATGTCDFILSQTEYELVNQSKSIDGVPKAFFYTMENEQHYLGLKMVSILFRERQWNVKFLQSELPPEYVVKEIDRWQPDVVGASFSLSYRVEELTKYLEAFASSKKKMEILIGGRLVSRHNFSGDSRFSANFIKSLDDLDRWFKEREEKKKDDINGDTGTSSIS